MNHCYVSGNLTREPELRATQGGTAILTFGIAVNDRKRDPQSGEWIDVPNFFDCTIFGKRADTLSKYLHKGMKVCIEGKLRWSQWSDKNGQRRTKVEIVVDEIEFMSQSKAQSDQQTQQANNYTDQYQNFPNSGSQGPTAYPQDLYAEEEIPF